MFKTDTVVFIIPLVSILVMFKIDKVVFMIPSHVESFKVCLKISGSESSLKMADPQVLIAKVRERTAMIFMTKPAAAC